MIKLNPRHLVAEVLPQVQPDQQIELRIADGQHILGNITTREFFDFLGDRENGGNPYFHKLHFDMGTVLVLIKRERFKNTTVRNTRRELFRRSFVKWSVVAVLFIGLCYGYTSYWQTPAVPHQNTGHPASVTAARGQMLTVTLSDGTKIWLNSDSQLDFPQKFVKGRARKVFLKGEAYFEVAKKQKIETFVVTTSNQILEVLGTHFNLNAYANEPVVKTVLLEGSVRLYMPEKGNTVKPTVLKPGEQATLSNGAFNVKAIDAGTAASWHAGEQLFRNERLDVIMRILSRKYAVDVTYLNNEIQDMKFGGIINYSASLKEIMAIIEIAADLDLNLQGRHLFVKRKQT